jgi:hypothetical protein
MGKMMVQNMVEKARGAKAGRGMYVKSKTYVRGSEYVERIIIQQNTLNVVVHHSGSKSPAGLRKSHHIF